MEVKRKEMTLEQAIDLLTDAYRDACGKSFVRNPLAYALYQVWKIADGRMEVRGR